MIDPISARARIGMFQSSVSPAPRSVRQRRVPRTSHTHPPTWAGCMYLLFLILTTLVITSPFTHGYKHICDVHTQHQGRIHTQSLPQPISEHKLFDSQDLSWISPKHRNKLTHAYSGNRRSRGPSLQLAYWNKGPSHLISKQPDIESLISNHHPAIFALGEANFKSNHDLSDVQQEGYKLYLGPGLDSLGVARVCVYVREDLVVKRRTDLEGSNVCTVWLQIGLPNKPASLYMFGYRQWRLPNQPDDSSASIAAQAKRWDTILNQWETALLEGKQTICMMDANIDHLTWDQENLPSSHSSVRLRPLTQALFNRILPQGVTQLVTEPTRAERGVPVTGLDHVYSNRPEKLSAITTIFTGMSDHKIILARQFSKDFQRTERYTKKRSFRNFIENEFKSAVKNMPELTACLTADSANTAASLLTNGLCRVLDEMAPIQTFQLRKAYVPYLSRDTKALQEAAKTAQKTAVDTGDPEDWRLYRSLRNQRTDSTRMDKLRWETGKLSQVQDPSSVWSMAKKLLGWANSGPPTQLYHDGKFVTSPGGLASTMNTFFIDKIKKLRKSIPTVDTDPLAKLRESMASRTCTFTISNVSQTEILALIRGLNGSKATGVDYIETRILKLVAEEIAPALTHVINISINTSTFADVYKYAKVVPLLKSIKLSPLAAKSYRPVSLLPVLSRVQERVIFSQFAKYLDQNNLLHPNHHGGRPGQNIIYCMRKQSDSKSGGTCL